MHSELWEDYSRETMTALIKVQRATSHHYYSFDLPDLCSLCKFSLTVSYSLQKAGHLLEFLVLRVFRPKYRVT